MLLSFNFSILGREIATKGGPKQVFMVQTMTNNNDDPIFSVPGDLAMNWHYKNNGHRIVLTGGHLSNKNDDDDNTHGLGNNYNINVTTGKTMGKGAEIEIANIQNCPYPYKSPCEQKDKIVQGTDHGSDYENGPAYGCYAIYVSKVAQRFPTSCEKLKLEMEEW